MDHIALMGIAVANSFESNLHLKKDKTIGKKCLKITYVVHNTFD